MTRSLSNWRLKDVDPGSARSADLTYGRGDGWIAVRAPGDTYLALVAAGRIEHPFRARGEAAAEWIRHREWWWHCAFEGETTDPGARVDLICDGLDTFADIYLDGIKVGDTDNMFRSMRLDVTGAIGPGSHHLAICFHPTAEALGDRKAPAWRSFDIFNQERRSLMRKAQYGWGWDWGPNLPTVGIWKPVRIEPRPKTSISGINFTTLSITQSAATVQIDVELTGPGAAQVELLDPDGEVVARGECLSTGSLSFDIANPRLWWTADLGEQPLYTLVATVAGAAEQKRRVGIRTIEIDESPDIDEPGTTFFRFLLNGTAIFAKGAAWIPASSFIAEVSRETYSDLIDRAVEANMNMLRVWGGGIYETDAFYDACDAAGLLVWQDFMFACAAYPDDPPFVANVRAEVEEQVRRLRTHPCIALWCGNNENDVLNHFDNYLNRLDNPLPGASLFQQHIPDILQALDPGTPYRAGSPLGGPSPNSMRGGDVHDWTVWHGAAPVIDADPVGPLMSAGPEGIAYTRYEEDLGRFVSEFGIHGAPAWSTLQRWLAPDDLALESQGFRDRIKDRGDKAADMASLVTGRPTTLAQYVDFTMLMQAEGLKFGIEHFRRRKPHCSGTLIWQYNDCWPCVSWSLIDYEGVAKASYFAAKRVFAPVLASFRRIDGDLVELWVTNDTLAPLNDVATVTLLNLSGGEDFRVEVPFKLDGNKSQAIWRGEVRGSAEHVLAVHAHSGTFAGNRLLLAPIKDLALPPDPGISWTVDGARISVTATRYALAVCVSVGDPAIRFDDNHFDLAPGETKTVTASEPVDPAAVEIWSWADRYGASTALAAPTAPVSS